jgi:hypothetical protein
VAARGGDRRISLHIVRAATLCARNIFRHGRRTDRNCDLYGSRTAAKGMAIRPRTNAQVKLSASLWRASAWPSAAFARRRFWPGLRAR